MKYLKTYEQIKEPKIGDYAIISMNIPEEKVVDQKGNDKGTFNVQEIFDNNIGQITDKTTTYYKITYILKPNNERVPTGLLDFSYWVARENILDFSSNIKDLEYYTIYKNKYNL